MMLNCGQGMTQSGDLPASWPCCECSYAILSAAAFVVLGGEGKLASGPQCLTFAAP